MKYVLIDKLMQGLYSPSKYAGMFNICTVRGAEIYEDLEIAKSIVHYLNSSGYEFEVIPLKDAILDDIQKNLSKGIDAKISEKNKYYIPNLFKNIQGDINMLIKERLL